MPARTYISKEEKCAPGFKAAKDCMTLLLGDNAAGHLKLKPLLVYHAETPRAMKGYSKAHLPVVWHSTKRAGSLEQCLKSGLLDISARLSRNIVGEITLSSKHSLF